MLYYELGSIGMKAYDTVKKLTKRIFIQEASSMCLISMEDTLHLLNWRIPRPIDVQLERLPARKADVEQYEVLHAAKKWVDVNDSG